MASKLLRKNSRDDLAQEIFQQVGQLRHHVSESPTSSISVTDEEGRQ
jgi:hypothetical protein